MKKMLIIVAALLTTLFAGCGGGGSTPVPVNVFHTTFTVGTEPKDLSTTRAWVIHTEPQVCQRIISE